MSAVTNMTVKADGSSIQTCVRIRPDSTGEPACFTVTSTNGTDGTDDIHAPGHVTACSLDIPFKNRGFDVVCGAFATNESIYRTVVKPKVEQFVSGFNTTCLAYGQTGAGKTYTLHGAAGSHDAHEHHELGLIVHALRDCFQLIRSGGYHYVLVLSFVEVYNGTVRDLLGPSAGLSVPSSGLAVRQKQGCFYAEGVSEVEIRDFQTAMALLKKGNDRKAMGSSHVHSRSSRSHTIFRLVLARSVDIAHADDGADDVEPEAGGVCTCSEINFVDLAGSETLTDKFGSGQQEETKHVNMSLTALKDVMTALQHDNCFVPYRNSVLTKLLCNSLGGNSLTVLLCMIAPERTHASVSVRTLEFGTIATKIENSVVLNALQLSNEHAGAAARVRLKGKDLHVSKVDVRMARDTKESAEEKSGTHAARGERKLDVVVENIAVNSASTVAVHACGPVDGPVAMVLHGYGTGAEASNWRYIWDVLVACGYRCLAVDMPGFGGSTGERQSYRTEKLNDKGESVETVGILLRHFGVSSNNKAVMVGYDWGASIALCCALPFGSNGNTSQRNSVAPLVSRVVAFHANWTTQMTALNSLTVPVLFLWVPVDQLHPIKIGTMLNRACVNCKARLVKLDCGRFKSSLSRGTWQIIGDAIGKEVTRFLPTHRERRNVSHENMASLLEAKQASIEDVSHQKHVDESEEEAEEEEEDEVDNTNEENADVEENAVWDNRSISSFGGGLILAEELQDSGLSSASSGLRSHLLSLISSPWLRGTGRQHQHHLNNEDAVAPVWSTSDRASTDNSVHDPLEQRKWAVARWREVLENGLRADYYGALTGQGNNHRLRPEAMRMFSSLPSVRSATGSWLSFADMVAFAIWRRPPTGWNRAQWALECFPRYSPGRQVLVFAPVCADFMSDDFLKMDQSSPDILVTCKAFISRDQTSAVHPGAIAVDVEVAGADNHTSESIVVASEEIFALNEPTCFRVWGQNPYDDFVVRGVSKTQRFPANYSLTRSRSALPSRRRRFKESSLIFEDGMTANYIDPLTKGILMECALALEPIVSRMDLSIVEKMMAERTEADEKSGRGYPTKEECASLLALQKEAIIRIRSIANTVHQVQLGHIDPTRYGGVDIGRLALFGRTHCHGMASVMAALLVPFGEMLGWEVRFRAGFFMKTGREVDKAGCPLPEWNAEGRKPRPVDDHTWLEVTFIPSLQSIVCDPSSHEFDSSLNYVYSRHGRRLPSPLRQCGSLPVCPPRVTFSTAVPRIAETDAMEPKQKKIEPKPYDWKHHSSL